MVCLGNICRSPLADGILLRKIKALNLDAIVDSAGTANYHIGKAPDARMIKTAAKHGDKTHADRRAIFQHIEHTFAGYHDADVIRRLESGMQAPGFILSTACAIAPDTPAENVMLLRELVEKYGRY